MQRKVRGVQRDEPGEVVRSQSKEFRLYPEAVGSLRRFLSREVRWSDFYTKQGSELFKKTGSEFRLPWLGFPAPSLTNFELQASYLPPMCLSFLIWRMGNDSNDN